MSTSVSGRRRQAGVTLIELIVAIVIVGAAMAGLTAAIVQGNRASVDPLIAQQKAAIAESLMGEILLKPYTRDPANPTPMVPGVRDTYGAVGEFNNYGLAPDGTQQYGIRDVQGSIIAGLDSYAVLVTVDPNATLTNVAAGDATRITVAVWRTDENQANDAFVLTGWRTRP